MSKEGLDPAACFSTRAIKAVTGCVVLAAADFC